MKKTDFVLSASALAAAIGALNQVVSSPSPEGGANTITVSAPPIKAEHKDAIAAAISHTAVQQLIRQMSGDCLAFMETDDEVLQERWLRIASSGEGALYGPGADSTLSVPDGVGGCYTNCHSACHGSRGWR